MGIENSFAIERIFITIWKEPIALAAESVDGGLVE
jgi:hypothetical protein